jgi:hypothetical protein
LTYVGTHGPLYQGYYISPYGFLANNSTPLSLTCIDSGHTISNGQTFTANVNLVPNLNLSQLMYGSNPNASQMYLWIAWLVAHFNQAPGDIQVAIWNVFNSNVAHTPGSLWWLQQAQINYGNMSYNGFRIYTDVNKRRQEYMVTPEPASIIGFGTGLFLVAGFVRRRIRA